jgi:hypothetical protein
MPGIFCVPDFSLPSNETPVQFMEARLNAAHRSVSMRPKMRFTSSLSRVA